MEASGSEASSQSQREEQNAPTGQGEDGSKLKKAHLKRTLSTKKKKTKKAAVSRSARVNYTVHQGEDMLLVISNASSQYDDSVWAPKRKGSKKKKLSRENTKNIQTKRKRTVCAKRKVETKVSVEEQELSMFAFSQETDDQRWGQNLPVEVLVNIFQMVVSQDNAVPFLCRVGRVCRLWNAAASSPILWRTVTLGHCWIPPGKSQLPKTEKKIQDTVTWLAQNRFSQLRDFALCHWTKNVDFTLQAVSQFCPHLGSIKLSYCSGLTAKAFQSLGLHSRALHSINIQYSEFQVEGLLEYLENHGSQIKEISFTHGLKNDKLLAALNRGCCPDLELLEVNTKLDSKDGELPVCIQALQTACPKLKTFRMLNVRPLHKTMRNGVDSSPGFPCLEELCIATTSYSYMTDKDLLGILFASTKLRILDLRGCSRITPYGLAQLPCPDLECLFWGQYFNSHVGLPSLKRDFHLVTQLWGRTLQQLDLANQVFTEEDLELAMGYLAAQTKTLRSLNLSGTRITLRGVRYVISRMHALDYLNLSSCRYLPRGLKKIYRGQEEIQQLLDKLKELV
ncbi:F-box/LRR-repeat protein 6 [Oryzias melastigma]|uniref:F-box and leucine rich repeat protein 6 n=1 Tax=Oryzias melastigma TaxID=30732 RepID=A0A3B3CKJ8_ORYME|nr:F-box/LRR-repeat protein 6 [Oryzias melastigma]